MEFFKIKRDLPFMSYGRLTTTISLLTFILAVYFLVINGLHYSIEFTGGTVMEVRYEAPVDLQNVRARIDSLQYGDVQVQTVGGAKDLLIRLPSIAGKSSAEISNRIIAVLQDDNSTATLRKVEFIGPSVGEELVTNGITAIVVVCLGIMAYLAIRFEWRFAVSAIIANLHDVVIILGFFAYFQWEFSLTVLAAVLAVLGYSVNESVVVFDRIRENFQKAAMRTKTIPEIIDNAITATMSRTIITHGSTEMMVLAMFFFGGPSLHYFALALTIGILFGIYSSVLVASPLLLLLGLTRENMVKPIKIKEEAVV